MVYFKLLLNDKREKSDSIYPVIVRVTYNRNNTSFSTGIRVQANLWDTSSLRVRSNHPMAQAYNKTISEFYSRIQTLAYRLIDQDNFSFDELRTLLKEGETKKQLLKSATFKVFGEQLVEDMLSVNETGNAIAIVYRTSINRFMAYANNPKLRFSEIDYTLLDGFRRRLLKDGMKQNTVSNGSTTAFTGDYKLKNGSIILLDGSRRLVIIEHKLPGYPTAKSIIQLNDR